MQPTESIIPCRFSYVHFLSLKFINHVYTKYKIYFYDTLSIMFGPHLIIDAKTSNKEKLSNLSLIENTLDDLVLDMNMTKILGPNVFEYKGVVPEDWGYTGITIIAESHLAIHTFPDKGHVFVDVFSCRDFDTSIVVNKLVEAFDLEEWDEQLLQRGREFPKSMTKAKLILDSERSQVLQSL